MRAFFYPTLLAMLGLALAYAWAGWAGLAKCALLAMLEIGFSFDNAVMNAGVLRQMDRAWQHRFLTWGLLIAVVGMYCLFPLLIVTAATGDGLMEVTRMALATPALYSQRLAGAHVQISAFGGMFLLMVLFHFLFDEKKKRHWIGMLERRLSRLGRLESIEVMLALGVLLAAQYALPPADRLHALAAGAFGIILYVLVSSVTALFSAKAYSGLAGFLYLQLLDASLSLDAVIGAFAISSDIVIIVLGLMIGAMFMRSLTVWLVRRGTLEQYVFLEHGAHYGIGALAIIMLVNMRLHVPEMITGLIGVTCILLSLYSSIRAKKC